MISGQPADTFSMVLFRHVDRLSFMVQNLLYAGGQHQNVFEDDKIKTFYLNLLHLESLLYPHLSKKNYHDLPLLKEAKSYLRANHINIRRHEVEYFIKCQEWFQFLIVQAHNAGFLKVEKIIDDELLENREDDRLDAEEENSELHKGTQV